MSSSDIEEFLGCNVSYETKSGEVYTGTIIDVDLQSRSITLEKPYLNCKPTGKASIKLFGDQMKNLTVLHVTDEKETKEKECAKAAQHSIKVENTSRTKKTPNSTSSFVANTRKASKPSRQTISGKIQEASKYPVVTAKPKVNLNRTYSGSGVDTYSAASISVSEIDNKSERSSSSSHSIDLRHQETRKFGFISSTHKSRNAVKVSKLIDDPFSVRGNRGYRQTNQPCTNSSEFHHPSKRDFGLNGRPFSHTRKGFDQRRFSQSSHQQSFRTNSRESHQRSSTRGKFRKGRLSPLHQNFDSRVRMPPANVKTKMVPYPFKGPGNPRYHQEHNRRYNSREGTVRTPSRGGNFENKRRKSQVLDNRRHFDKRQQHQSRRETSDENRNRSPNRDDFGHKLRTFLPCRKNIGNERRLSRHRSRDQFFVKEAKNVTVQALNDATSQTRLDDRPQKDAAKNNNEIVENQNHLQPSTSNRTRPSTSNRPVKETKDTKAQRSIFTKFVKEVVGNSPKSQSNGPNIQVARSSPKDPYVSETVHVSAMAEIVKKLNTIEINAAGNERRGLKSLITDS